MPVHVFLERLAIGDILQLSLLLASVAKTIVI